MVSVVGYGIYCTPAVYFYFCILSTLNSMLIYSVQEEENCAITEPNNWRSGPIKRSIFLSVTLFCLYFEYWANKAADPNNRWPH